MNTSTCPPPAARISRAASSARSRSRPVIATRAPIAARPRAVALPMPPLAPVTSTVFPAIDPPAVRSIALLPSVFCEWPSRPSLSGSGWCAERVRCRDRTVGGPSTGSCWPWSSRKGGYSSRIKAT